MLNKFYQSDGGEITMISLGDQVILRVFSKHNQTKTPEYYILPNLDGPRPFLSGKFLEVEVNPSKAIEAAFEAVDFITNRTAKTDIPG